MVKIDPLSLRPDSEKFFTLTDMDRYIFTYICLAIAEHKKSSFIIPTTFFETAFQEDNLPPEKLHTVITRSLDNFFQFTLHLSNIEITNQGENHQVLERQSFPLFTELSMTTEGVIIRVSPLFITYSEDWKKTDWDLWTDLKGYLPFSSKYTLRLLQILQKVDSPWTVDFSFFRKKMAFPASYPTSVILSRIQQSIDQITYGSLFKKVGFWKSYGDTQGRPLESLTFYFDQKTEQTEPPSIPIKEIT